jgi:hypothetical protein
MSSPVIGMTNSQAALPFESAENHLLAELEWLKLILHQQVQRMRSSGLLVENDFLGLYVADEQVDAILRGDTEQTVLPETPLQQEREQIDARIEASAAAESGFP